MMKSLAVSVSAYLFLWKFATSQTLQFVSAFKA